MKQLSEKHIPYNFLSTQKAAIASFFRTHGNKKRTGSDTKKPHSFIPSGSNYT